MTFASRLLAPLLLASLTGTACTTEDGGNLPSHDCDRVSSDPTPGLEGKVQFVWGQGLFTCLFGCTGDNPLVSMAEATLAVVDAGGIGEFAARSSDPAVLAVEHSGGDIMTVLGNSPGEAEIELVSPSGIVLDSLPVRVRDVYEALTYDDLRIYRDADAVIRLELYDDEGCRMVGTGAINYALASGLTSENLDLDPPDPPELNDSFEQLAVRGGQPARGALSIVGPGVSDDLELRVVGEDEVDHIDLSEELVVAAGSTSFLYPYVYDDGGNEILGAVCAWSIEPADSPVVVQPEGDSVKLTSDVATEAVLTCTLGDASADVRLEYE